MYSTTNEVVSVQVCVSNLDTQPCPVVVLLAHRKVTRRPLFEPRRNSLEHHAYFLHRASRKWCEWMEEDGGD